jgi:ring-1,2-phenylacetyl-CoA epoxidase subunit PaaD
MVKESQLDEEKIWSVLENVKDPEIPVLSVVDLGIISNVLLTNNTSHITISPTFVGCPAIEIMKQSIHAEVMKLGFEEVEVLIDFETPWSTNRMKPEAKIKLEKFGLAPPSVVSDNQPMEEQLNKVRCPYCASTDTTMRSAFGSTLCRAIRFCFNCKQGFEQFKPV